MKIDVTEKEGKIRKIRVRWEIVFQEEIEYVNIGMMKCKKWWKIKLGDKQHKVKKGFFVLLKRAPQAQSGITCAKALDTKPNCCFNLS